MSRKCVLLSVRETGRVSNHRSVRRVVLGGTETILFRGLR